MNTKDTGVWTAEFRPKEVRDILDAMKGYGFDEQIHELEEILGLV